MSATIARLVSAMMVFGTVACGQESTGVPASGVVDVQGIVRAQVPPGDGRQTTRPGLSGVDVTVIAGAASGATTTTNPAGEYRLQLPRGTFKLRWSKAGYDTTISEEMFAASDRITMSDVVLNTAAWAITGVVTDGRANPVPRATVTIAASVFGNLGSATTDIDGRYRFASTQPHFTTVSVSVRKDGYAPPLAATIKCCNAAGDTPFDVRVQRILSISMSGPTMLAVGDAGAIPINDIALDDGSHRFIYLFPTSSDASVIAVERGFMGQQGYGIRGVGPGTAIVTCEFEGVQVQLNVRVVDR
jgi:hypothetical protein